MSMRGRPLMAKKPEEQCAALTIMTEWKRKNKIGPRCPFYARFLINHKQLCLKHAHLEALHLMLKSGKALRLADPPRPRSPYDEVVVVE